MRLSPRLKAIAGMVPDGSAVADIGTDHGYIPVFLIESGKAKWAVASDINSGPLEKAREVIRQHRLEGRIDTRLGDGLDVLKRGEADTIVLAGMGGMLIRDVLQAGEMVLEGITRLVLQPMNAQDVVRKWLTDNGYAIVDETLAREKDRIYQIIAAEPGCQHIDDPIYLEIGRILIEKKHPLLPHLVDRKITEYSKIITGLQGSREDSAADKLKEYTDRLKRLHGVMEDCRD
jgi:tRNA (adenine22-N1)-methyltransferase